MLGHNAEIRNSIKDVKCEASFDDSTPAAEQEEIFK